MQTKTVNGKTPNLEKVSERILRLKGERLDATWKRLEQIDVELIELRRHSKDKLIVNF